MERRGLNIRKGFLKAVLPVFRALPLPVASRFVSGIGRLEYRLRPKLRHSFDAAVAQGRTVLDGNWDLSAVGRELAGNHVLWRTRDLLLDGVPDQRALDMFTVEGREHLDAAMAQGKGCIVLANHFGAHLLPAHWLFRRTIRCGSTWSGHGIFRGTCRDTFRPKGRSGKTSFHLAAGCPGRLGQLDPSRCPDHQGGAVAVPGGRRSLDREADRDGAIPGQGDAILDDVGRAGGPDRKRRW